MPLPATVVRVATNNPGLELNHVLGAEYEKKKQKLQEELQMDYKRYIDQTRHPKVRVQNSPRYHSSSLPIAERTSVKEKLREERNREYNLFLQEQVKPRRRGQISLPYQPEEQSNFKVVHIYPQDTSRLGSNAEIQPSRKDAATFTDIVKTKKGRKAWDLGHQRQRACMSRKEIYHSSEDEFNTDSEKDIGFSNRRKQNGQRHKYIKEDKHHRAERDSMDIEHDEVFIDQNNDHNWNSKTHHTDGKGKMAETIRPASIAIRKNPIFPTGLMIGQMAEQEASQRKKEQYKQELLNQIAEKRENKRREKFFYQISTAATDPNKADSLRHFGSVHNNYERWKPRVPNEPDTANIVIKENLGLKEFPDSNMKLEHREPPRRPKKAFPSPTNLEDNAGLQNAVNPKVFSPEASFEEYKRDFSIMMGDLTTKVVSDVPPPLPPKVENSYKTPYDDVYNYYASRHPMEPRLSHNQSNLKDKPEAAQEFDTRTFPQQSRNMHRHTGGTQSIPDFGQRITVIPLRHHSSESEQRRENAFNYQAALQQQIKDIEEHRRTERQQRELYEAKIAAEMMSYDPWGKAGGGAPNKDQSGNLITNLNQMHKTNEENYKTFNKANSLGLIEEGTPRFNRRPLLPGNNDPVHSQRQDRYKEELMEQIKEGRRKQAEERERQRIMEEKDEKRVTEERMRLLKEYEEEEQRKKMKIQREKDDRVRLYENKDRHQKKDTFYISKKTTERKKEDRPPTRDRTASETWVQRARSPPVPSLQRQPSNTNDPSPPVTSQIATKTEHSETATQNHVEQVLGQTQLQQDEQQEIITKLAALRAVLEKEKKQVETKLMQTNLVNECSVPLTRHQRQTKQARGDAAELQHNERVLSPAQKPRSPEENRNNFREFNQLKYRDTPSREEFLYSYPDPPFDAPNLDLQQQALLREQQRQLQLMKKSNMESQCADFLDEQEDFPSHRNNLHGHRNSMLPSDTAFLDVFSCEGDFIPQPSAESWQKASHHRRHNYEEEAACVNHTKDFEPDAPPGTSDTFVNQVRHNGRHRRPSENQCGDEMDILSLRSTRSARERPISVGTVATEPWLRTSTAEPEHLGYRRAGRRPQAQL